MGNKAAFFDRDGVLNEDVGYLYKKEDFVWVAGAIETIKKCKELGYYVFVITNQSGIARGFYTEKDVQELHRWMNEALSGFGAHIDEFFYCPHYEKGVIREYSYACDCRKPSPEMIEKACRKYDIDKKHSFMVGDKISDMDCAANAGVLGIRFSGGNLLERIATTLQL